MRERVVARLRSRVEVRLWRVLGRGVTLAPQAHLESLRTGPEGRRTSGLDPRRTGPVTVGGPAGDTIALILRALDTRDEPPALLALRTAVRPRVDLPEILLDIAARTGLTDALTHVTERTAGATDLPTSRCAVRLAEACNTGPEPLIRHDVPALRRDRLFWIGQHDIRDDTVIAAKATLVSAQHRRSLAQAWGGGEVASADGLRFVVPIRTVHAGPHPTDVGVGRGVTWYPLMSNPCSGLPAMTVPGHAP